MEHVLTHSSPGATCARAVAVPQVQADAGGPVPGMSSSASGRHTQSSLWEGETEGGKMQISREKETDGRSAERGGEKGEREKQQDFRTYVL